MKKSSVSSKKTSIMVDETVFNVLSPLQQKIVAELTYGPLTLSELSRKTKKDVHTLGKQLSLLQLRTKCDTMTRKGITKPLVKKYKDAGIKTTYHLQPQIAVFQK